MLHRRGRGGFVATLGASVTVWSNRKNYVSQSCDLTPLWRNKIGGGGTLSTTFFVYLSKRKKKYFLRTNIGLTFRSPITKFITNLLNYFLVKKQTDMDT